MVTRCIFIYGNLKVSPFLPYDHPVPGCELVTYDKESYTFGTLWDTGVDAGLTKIGKGRVYGQIWKIVDQNSIEEISQFCGVRSGISERVVVPVIVETPDIRTEIPAITFHLTKIEENYKIIDDGLWLIRR